MTNLMTFSERLEEQKLFETYFTDEGQKQLQELSNNL